MIQNNSSIVFIHAENQSFAQGSRDIPVREREILDNLRSRQWIFMFAVRNRLIGFIFYTMFLVVSLGFGIMGIGLMTVSDSLGTWFFAIILGTLGLIGILVFSRLIISLTKYSPAKTKDQYAELLQNGKLVSGRIRNIVYESITRKRIVYDVFVDTTIVKGLLYYTNDSRLSKDDRGSEIIVLYLDKNWNIPL